MQFGYTEHCLEHDTGPRHPETADRLQAIREGLKQRYEVVYREPELSSREAIRQVHDPSYVQDVESFCRDGGGKWDADTIASEATWEAALAAAGLAEWAAKTALEGASGRKTPFALGRPPGHHAVFDDAMGFCFFNNTAVAAESALESSADSVAIIDWDVHHGNGTQDLFYERNDVFYASIHEEGLYPGTGEANETGTGVGEGANLNVPLPSGVPDSGYLHVIEEVIVPAFDRFDPDLLLVSAGFDAHQQDPISRMHLSTEGYALLTDRLRRLGVPTGYVLEGGYGLETLADGVAMVHETFDGRDPIVPDGDPNRDIVDLTATLREEFGLD